MRKRFLNEERSDHQRTGKKDLKGRQSRTRGRDELASASEKRPMWAHRHAVERQRNRVDVLCSSGQNPWGHGKEYRHVDARGARISMCWSAVIGSLHSLAVARSFQLPITLPAIRNPPVMGWEPDRTKPERSREPARRTTRPS